MNLWAPSPKDEEGTSSAAKQSTSPINLYIVKGKASHPEHYPISIKVENLADLLEVAKKGFTCARFKDNACENDNFVNSDVLALTCKPDVHNVEEIHKLLPNRSFYYLLDCSTSGNENQPLSGNLFILLPTKDEITDFVSYIAQATEVSQRVYCLDSGSGEEIPCFERTTSVAIIPPMNASICGYVDEEGKHWEIGGELAQIALSVENSTVEKAAVRVVKPKCHKKSDVVNVKAVLTATTTTTTTSSSGDVLLDALDYINPDCDYSDWVRVGMALEAEGYDCDVWEDWSARGGKYTPGQCTKLWRGFHDRENGVTGGTIVKLAKEEGFVPARSEVKVISRECKQERLYGAPALKAYLLALHDEEDEVQILVDAARSNGKWRPSGKGDVYQVGALVERLDSNDVEGALRRSVNNEAGAWVRINPVKNKDGRDDSVAKFKYVLVESDELPKDEQVALYKKLDLPVAALVDSGGKSVHAIVHVDAENLAEYHFRVGKLYELLEAAGLKPDKADKNPSRLSRLPGVKRGDSEQALLGTNLGAESWKKWFASRKPREEKTIYKYKPRAYSHDDEAEVLKQTFGEQLCYTASTGWLTYDGVRWLESDDKLNPAVIQLVRDLRSRQLNEAEAGVKTFAQKAEAIGVDLASPRRLDAEQKEAYLQYKDAKKYYDFVVGCGSGSADIHILRRAEGALNRDFNEFDGCAHLLNTPTGTFDLRTGEKHANRAEDLVTQVTNVTPSDDGREKWERALKQWFVDDEELIKYVQRVCGLAAFGAVRNESLYIAYGAGKNGKTTFWNVIASVLGGYSTTFDTDTLVNPNANNTVEVAALKGKRLAISEETVEGKKFNSKMLKTIASRAELHATPKYKAPMNFKPTHTPVLCTNFLPDLNARDYGTLRRISIIPFNARFENTGSNRDDCSFQERIVKEAGGSILQWIIDGAVEVYKLNYQIPLPAVVKRAFDEYKSDNDWLAHFLDECCSISPLLEGDEEVTEAELIDRSGGWEVKSSELYNEYSLWAKKNNEDVYSVKAFKTELQRNGFAWRHTFAGSFYYGLKLRA